MKRLASILTFSLPVFFKRRPATSTVSYGAWTLNPVKSALEGLAGMCRGGGPGQDRR